MKTTAILACLFLAGTVSAASLEDNSFKLEEAHNQEDGEYQHILYYESHEESAVDAEFVTEVPLGGQTHQASIVIPYQELANPSNEKGIGDVELNYRYQLVKNEQVAMAPSIGLIMGTGDYKKDLGHGATGIKAVLPVSVEISPKFASHFNVGYAFIPDAKNAVADKADIHETLFGSSLVYRYSDVLHFLAEFYGEYSEEVIADESTVGGTELWFNPGARWGFKAGHAQMVVGAAYLNGVGPTAGETGFSLYLSLEH